MIPLSLLESHLWSILQYAKHFYFPSHLRHDYSNHNIDMCVTGDACIGLSVGEKIPFFQGNRKGCVGLIRCELDLEGWLGPELRDWPWAVHPWGGRTHTVTEPREGIRGTEWLGLPYRMFEVG